MADVNKILAQRATTHGDYGQQAKMTQMLQRAIMDYNNSPLSDVMRESIHMICHKLARISVGRADIQDHWDDIAGYATLVSKDLESKKPKAD